MLVVRVEYWPFGVASRREVVALGVIGNDGSGTLEMGNYDVWLSLPDHPGQMDRAGRLEGYARTQPLWEIVAQGVRAAIGRKGKTVADRGILAKVWQVIQQEHAGI